MNYIKNAFFSVRKLYGYDLEDEIVLAVLE